MSRLVAFLLGLFAATVFVACLVVHLLTLVPGTVFPESVMLLHLGALLALLAMGIHGDRAQRRAVRLGWNRKKVRRAFGDCVPPGGQTLATAVFIYALLNFVCFVVTVEGRTSVQDGKFVLKKKGVPAREISEEEYHKHERRQLRGFSGHWLLFAGAATGYFLFVYPRARKAFPDPPAS